MSNVVGAPFLAHGLREKWGIYLLI